MYNKRKHLTSMQKKVKPLPILTGRNNHSYLQDSELYQVDSQASESVSSFKNNEKFIQENNKYKYDTPSKKGNEEEIQGQKKNNVVQISQFLEKQKLIAKSNKIGIMQPHPKTAVQEMNFTFSNQFFDNKQDNKPIVTETDLGWQSNNLHDTADRLPYKMKKD